ncbi:MAG: hypothetical protein WDA09_11535, partial [Bacteriovoracaceae bacterium]
DNWKCILPKIEPPDPTSFPGLDYGSSQREYVTLGWTPPLAGYYTNYVIFWKSGTTAFNWGEAIAAFEGATNAYSYMMIDGDEIETQLQGFADGSYTFGILTYHLYMSDEGPVEKWSGTNTRFLKCHINNSTNDTVTCNF